MTIPENRIDLLALPKCPSCSRILLSDKFLIECKCGQKMCQNCVKKDNLCIKCFNKDLKNG